MVNKVFNLKDLFKRKTTAGEEDRKPLTKAEIRKMNKENPRNIKGRKYSRPQRKLSVKMQKVLENPKKKGF